VRYRRRHSAPLSDPDHLRAARRALQDWRLFSAWTDEIFKLFTLSAAADAPDILHTLDELDAYIDQLVDRRRHALSDDLISKLIRAEDDGDRLTHNELLMIASAVLAGGTDTTRNQLAAAVRVFCDHPDQWALLAAQPELAPRAVEEVMRHTPVTFGTSRTAVEDVELAGVLIPDRHSCLCRHRRRQPRPVGVPRP
jgi:cytochrome P450